MLNQCIKKELNTKIIYIIELFIIKVYLNKLLIISIELIKNILRKLWINSWDIIKRQIHDMNQQDQQRRS